MRTRALSSSSRSSSGWPARLSPAATPVQDLPDYLRVELKRLEETWNILDQYAAKVWPGWTGYRDVPFLFEYPNGVRLLVGHPSPMQGFEPVPGLEVQGKKVYLDRRAEIPLDLKPPIIGGGGPLLMGGEKMVNTVRLTMSALPPAGREREARGRALRQSAGQRESDPDQHPRAVPLLPARGLPLPLRQPADQHRRELRRLLRDRGTGPGEGPGGRRSGRGQGLRGRFPGRPPPEAGRIHDRHGGQSGIRGRPPGRDGRVLDDPDAGADEGRRLQALDRPGGRSLVQRLRGRRGLLRQGDQGLGRGPRRLHGSQVEVLPVRQFPGAPAVAALSGLAGGLLPEPEAPGRRSADHGSGWATRPWPRPARRWQSATPWPICARSTAT